MAGQDLKENSGSKKSAVWTPGMKWLSTWLDHITVWDLRIHFWEPPVLEKGEDVMWMGVPRVLDVCSRLLQTSLLWIPCAYAADMDPTHPWQWAMLENSKTLFWLPWKLGSLIAEFTVNHLYVFPMFSLEYSNMGMPALCHANKSQIAQTSIAKATGQFFALIPFNLSSVFNAFD